MEIMKLQYDTPEKFLYIVENVQYLRSNRINDLFSYIDSDGQLEYITFPSTLQMDKTQVKNYLETYFHKSFDFVNNSVCNGRGD